MLEAHGEGGCPNLTQPGGLEQLGQVASAGAGEVGLIVDIRVERTGSAPEEAERSIDPAVIPHARDDDTASPGHAGHLGQPRDRILHEMDDELREGGVKGIIRERHLLGRRSSNVDARVARPRRGNERIGRVDCRHRVRSQPSDQLAGERSRAAADVEDPLPSAHRGEVCQLTRQQARVPTHEAVIGLGGDIEAHVPNLRYRCIGGGQVRLAVTRRPRTASWSSRTLR